MRFRLCAAALLVTWCGSMVVAQNMITPEELDKAMKTAQTAQQAAQKAIKSAAYADAREQIGIMKKAIHDSREFWIHHKKDDAIKTNEESVTKLEAVEKLLEATPVDTAAVAAGMKEVGGTCLACHKPYRVRDPVTNDWILKPGTIGG